MKWDGFRRSDNVEDFTDINKPVSNKREAHETINERLALTNSDLAREAGSENINKGK